MTHSSLDSIRLRFARREDVALILRLIRELAAYEKLSDEVAADEARLAAALFGEQRYAEVVLAERSGAAVGFALFFHNFSTFLALPGIYLEDLYVEPASRGLGIGALLLSFLAHLARERGCGRLEWAVLDWNESAIGFYRRLGAKAMDDWTVYRVTGDALGELAGHFPEDMAPAG